MLQMRPKLYCYWHKLVFKATVVFRLDIQGQYGHLSKELMKTDLSALLREEGG